VKFANKNKYDTMRRPSGVPRLDSSPQKKIVFHDRADRRQGIDLSCFVDSSHQRQQMLEVFGWYIWNALQTASTSTRTNKLAALKKFNEFLNWLAAASRFITTTHEISEDLLLEYQLWLETQAGVQRNTAHNYYITFTSILKHLQKRKPELIRPGLNIPLSTFLDVAAHRKAPLIDINDLRKISEAATLEINEIRTKHEQALKFLEEGELPQQQKARVGHWRSLANVLVYLVKGVGIGSYPRSPQRFAKHGHNKINDILNMYVPVSDRPFIPFLLRLFILTAINVESLFKLRRDCLNEHPLPFGLTILGFDKPRAGSARDKKVIVPTKQKNGVTDLIGFLLRYTEPWVPFAREVEKEELLLFRSPGNGKREVRSPGANFLNHSLRDFIRRHDLPHFSLDQIRPTIATLLYLQTRDIFRIQRLLCHEHVHTTIRYIREELTRQEHDIQMHKGIESMLSMILDEPSEVGRPTVFTEPVVPIVGLKVEQGELSNEQAESITSGSCSTGIGRCRDPYDSPQPGEKKGVLCKQLHKCIFCPNAWIFEDDLPKVVYFRDTLNADRKNFTESRWEAIHGDAYREVTEEILPSFSQKAIADALIVAKQLFSPYPITEGEYGN
jgi:hypothetical protein